MSKSETLRLSFNTTRFCKISMPADWKDKWTTRAIDNSGTLTVIISDGSDDEQKRMKCLISLRFHKRKVLTRKLSEGLFLKHNKAKGDLKVNSQKSVWDKKIFIMGLDQTNYYMHFTHLHSDGFNRKFSSVALCPKCCCCHANTFQTIVSRFHLYTSVPLCSAYK